MHPIIGWLAANPYEALGLAYVALGALNAILPHKGDEASALRRLLDWMAPLVPAKFAGTLKMPLRASRPGDGTPPPAALVLVALALGGCGTIEAAPPVALALGVAAAVMLGAWMVRTARALRFEDASDAREATTPHLVPLSDEHARAMASAIEAKARRRAGIPPALALALLSAWLTAPGCHLSHGARAGLAFVAAVPTIEEGIKVYRAQRPQLERQVGIDARAACESRPSPTAYNDCSEAIAVPRWRALDDVRLAVGSYEAAVSAAASGLDNDLPAAASKVIAALASLGVRVAQEVK